MTYDWQEWNKMALSEVKRPDWDDELHMIVQPEREFRTNHLLFQRWLVEHGYQNGDLSHSGITLGGGSSE